MEQYSLFDTHAHYDHPLFKGNGPQILSELFRQGTVNGVVIPAISFETNLHRDLFPSDAFPYVFFAAGLHPKCATNEGWWPVAKQEAFAGFLEDPRTVAVKTGLDFCKKSLSEGQKAHQIRFFEYLIDQANEAKLPLVLHVRDAEDKMLELLRDKALQVEAEVHCYTKDLETAEALIAAGITRFGIGGMLTRDGMDELRTCVKALPLSAILIETDAPFVRPKGYTAAYNTSETMMETVQLIAELKGLSVGAVAEAVEQNAAEFFFRK